MSSLSPQIASFSNPFNISADSYKFSLDFNQSIPNIMNSNNDYLMNDSNALISNNGIYYYCRNCNKSFKYIFKKY